MEYIKVFNEYGGLCMSKDVVKNMVQMLEDIIENGESLYVEMSERESENYITMVLYPESMDVNADSVCLYSGFNAVSFMTNSLSYDEEDHEYICNMNNTTITISKN